MRTPKERSKNVGHFARKHNIEVIIISFSNTMGVAAQQFRLPHVGDYG